jgi:LmeA-like phospholipid-binding
VRNPFARLRRTPLLVTVVVTVAAVLLAGVGDVLLERAARSRIAGAAACRLRPSGPVSAELTGTLAGLRLLTGHVGTVRIAAEDVRRDGTSLTVAAELHGVTTGGSIGGGSATATLPYRELDGRLGSGVAGLRPGADGHGGLVLTGTLAGIPLPLTVHVRLSTGADRVTVTPTDVSLLGQDIPVASLAADPRTAQLAGRLAPRSLTLPQLPDGVRLVSVTTDGDGLRLNLTLTPRATSGTSHGCAR